MGRVPASNAGNLTETTVSLAGEARNTPAGNDAFATMTLGYTTNVDHFVLSKDGFHINSLLEEGLGEINLGGDVTTVHLDLHDVGLLLAKLNLLDLGVSDDADAGAVVLDTLKLGGDVGVAFLGVLLGVLGESLALGLEPVLVEATLDFVTQVLSPNGGEGAEASGGFNIANNSNCHHRRGLDDSYGFDCLLLVKVGARALYVTKDVSHAGLVAHEGGKVALLSLVIPGERTNATTVVLGALLG
jgi:hypothetical protein